MKIQIFLRRAAIIAVLLSTQILYGQVQTDSAFVINQIITGVDLSDVIIEGRVEEKMGYWNSTSDHVYTSNIIRVNRIWKDNSIETPIEVDNTVEIVTYGGTVEGFQHLITHNAEFNYGKKGLFVCDFNTLPANPSGPAYRSYTDAA